MKKILITGGAGFIGYHLSMRESSLGNEVTILDNFQRSSLDEEFQSLINKPNVIFMNKDVTVQETFLDLKIDYYDIVYHFVALNGTENFYKQPVKVLKIGCLSTIYLLDWICKHNNAPKVIYSSSPEVYSGIMKIMEDKFPIPTPENVPLGIDDASNPRWSYAVSKMLGEVAFFNYYETFGFDNFNIIRLANIYGPRMGNGHVISEFIIRYLKGEAPFKIVGSEQSRSFLYIDDVLDAMEKIVQSDIKKQIINIGNEKSETKIIDLAKAIFDFENKQYDFAIHDPPKGSVERKCLNTENLKLLGVKEYTSLKEGLRKTFEWYKKDFLNKGDKSEN